MQAATVGATVGDGGGGVANDEAASPSAPACNEGGNQSHVANDEAASMIKSPAEERVTTSAIDVALWPRCSSVRPRCKRSSSRSASSPASSSSPFGSSQRGSSYPCPTPRPSRRQPRRHCAVPSAQAPWQGARQQRPRSRSSNAPCARSVRSIHVPRVWYVGSRPRSRRRVWRKFEKAERKAEAVRI